MSNLPAAGVQLVAQDYNSFMAAINNATAAVDAFNKATSAGGKTSAPAFAGGVQTATKAVEGLSFESLVGANVLGNVLTNALMTAWNGLTGFVQQAWSGAGALQDLTINLETLSARELQYAGVTDDMSEALKLGEDRAAYMLKQLQELSIQSPFEYQQVVGVFQMGMAFGQSSEMALKLTKSITDLAAVNKAVPGIMQRLSYNFSQMAQVGKITARDVRDLALAGLDLKKVFELQLHKTLKQVNDDLASGKMTFKDVSQALVDYTDKYIGPAAKRASRTLGGLASTMRDVSFFVGANLFKASADRIAEALGTVLDKVLAFANSPAFIQAGAALDILTEKFLAFAGFAPKVVDEYTIQMGETIQETTDDWGAQFAETAGAAFEWGINIIAQLADGIVQGITQSLSWAIDAVSGFLSYWLAPGSPPRVAPNIDNWGLEAMNQFLKGFTEADFSLLDGIQRPLQQAMQTAAAAGLIDPDTINQTMAGILKSAISALGSGEGFAGVLSQIEAAAGPFGAEVAMLAEKQFELAAATKAAAEAQKELMDAQKRAFDAGKKVRTELEEYNDLVRSGADKATLKAKLAQINADRQAQKAAQQEAVGAAEKLQTAQEGIGTLREQISLQSKLVEQLTELAKLQTETAERAGGGRGGTEGGGGGKYEVPESIGESASKIFENIRKEAEKKLKDTFKPLTDAWSDWEYQFDWLITKFWIKVGQFRGQLKENPIFQAVVDAIDVVKQKFSETGFFDQMIHNFGFLAGAAGVATVAFQAVNTVIGITATLLKLPLAPIILVGVAVAALAAAWQTNLGGIQDITKMAGEIIVLVFENIARTITDWKDSAISTWNKFWQDARGGLDAFVSGVQGVWNAFMVILQDKMDINFIEMRATWIDTWNGIKEISAIIWGNIVSWFETNLVQPFNEKMDKLKAIWEAVWPWLKYAFEIGWQRISEYISQKLEEQKQQFLAIVNWFAEADKWLFNAGVNIIQGLIDGMLSMAGHMAQIVTDIINKAVRAALNALDSHSPSRVFMEIGANASIGMGEGIKGAANEPIQASKDLANQTTSAAVQPPSIYRTMSPGGPKSGVVITIGDVYISDAQEGAMFEARVQRAVMNALGAV